MVMPPHRNDSKRTGTWPSQISTRILWVQTLRCWLSLLVQANSSSMAASREHVFTSLLFLEIFLQPQDVLHILVFQKSRVLGVWKSPIASLLHATIITIYTPTVNCVRECFNPAERSYLLHLPTNRQNQHEGHTENNNNLKNSQ